jgi:hypothetical protein
MSWKGWDRPVILSGSNFGYRFRALEKAMSNAEIETNVLQICKIGDSVGLILPDELLSRLNLLTPHKPKHARAMEIARKVMHEYRDTFTALAK